MKTISLTQNKVALVDDEDFEELNKVKWFAEKSRSSFYATRGSSKINGKQTMIRMHSVIIQTPKCMQTDHRDGDGLNNQRSNLRVCTHAENTRNRGKHKTNKSGFKGVYLNKENKRWRAEIRSNGKKIFLGSYISKELAYKVYVEACKKYHREFSNIG